MMELLVMFCECKQWISQKCAILFTYLYNTWFRVLVEPRELTWATICSTHRVYGVSSKWAFTERYTPVSAVNLIWPRPVHGSSASIANIAPYEPAPQHTLCIVKTLESKYILRVNTHALPNQPDLRLVQSPFLLIEYIHVDMPRAINISLPITMFIAGNEILSAAHVHRILKYTLGTSTFIFDDLYMLRIMDHNVRDLLVLSNQYVRIDIDGYTIITI